MTDNSREDVHSDCNTYTKRVALIRPLHCWKQTLTARPSVWGPQQFPVRIPTGVQLDRLRLTDGHILPFAVVVREVCSSQSNDQPHGSRRMPIHISWLSPPAFLVPSPCEIDVFRAEIHVRITFIILPCRNDEFWPIRMVAIPRFRGIETIDHLFNASTALARCCVERCPTFCLASACMTC